MVINTRCLMKKILLLTSVFVFAAFTASFAAADGKAVFAKCQGCHGVNAEKKAMGVSEVIKGMPAAEIEKRLNAYKTGTFTDSKMNMMKSQTAKLSADEIKAVAAYVSKLK